MCGTGPLAAERLLPELLTIMGDGVREPRAMEVNIDAGLVLHIARTMPQHKRRLHSERAWLAVQINGDEAVFDAVHVGGRDPQKLEIVGVQIAKAD